MPIIHMNLKLHRLAGTLLAIAGACSLLESAQAGSSTFTDTNRDLMLVFRKTGFDGSQDVGQYVYEIDIGQASIYYGATRGSSIPITAYTASQLTNLFDNLNDFSWSVSSCVPNYGDSGDPSKPIATLWVTDPRPVPTISPSPWVRESVYTQGGAAAEIESILSGATTYAASATNSTYNTSTARAIPYGNGNNANGYLTGVGNFDGNFQGNVENTTPPTFTTAGSPSASDFYELQPGSGTGTYLGYFQLATNGTMTFYALPLALPPPNLSLVLSNPGTINISFLSTSNGTYTLHYTNSVGLASGVSTWPAVSTNIVGDGTVKTFQQPINGTGIGTFYSVSVH
jgi:hypothetical protein